ncbi:beta-galactosidase [Nonomuraea wenchangensis]
MDLMAGAGIAVDLTTPTASPPPWLGHLPGRSSRACTRTRRSSRPRATWS